MLLLLYLEVEEEDEVELSEGEPHQTEDQQPDHDIGNHDNHDDASRHDNSDHHDDKLEGDKDKTGEEELKPIDIEEQEEPRDSNAKFK